MPSEKVCLVSQWQLSGGVLHSVEAREVPDEVPTLDPEHLLCLGSEDAAG